MNKRWTFEGMTPEERELTNNLKHVNDALTLVRQHAKDLRAHHDLMTASHYKTMLGVVLKTVEGLEWILLAPLDSDDPADPPLL